MDRHTLKKPAETLASEVVYYLFDGFLNNNPNDILLKVYYNWLDSKTYQKSFAKYLEKYTVYEKQISLLYIPAHPFEEIDKKWLEQLGGNISNAVYTTNFLSRINERINSKAASHLNISFWKNLKQLLEFNSKNISQIASFNEAVSFYTQHFYKLDEAIRGIYTNFLHQKELLEPIQEYYKNFNVIFLDKWFKYVTDYKSNQTGVLKQLIQVM